MKTKTVGFFLFFMLFSSQFTLAEPDSPAPLLYNRYVEEKLAPLSNVQTAAIKDLISRVKKGQDNFASIDPLNNYNFGELLNKLIGNLYKSHGCLHVAPRNSFLLYELLPIGSKITIYPYSKKVDPLLFEGIPFLADMINFESDIESLKKKTPANKNIEFFVYPSSGAWIAYANEKPICKILVEPGPMSKFYILEGRDASGRPLFMPDLAYPTQSGIFYVFKKVKDYVSNYYYDLTIVPMGAAMKKAEAGWIYQGKNGKWSPVPAVIQSDLLLVPEQRVYDYYAQKSDDQGNLVFARWGGNTFGKYVILLSKDMRLMSPQIVHTSGDLLMEERSLMKDLLLMLTATPESMDECIPFSENFDLYQTCYNFTRDPSNDKLIEPLQSGNYKAFYGLPLDLEESSLINLDVIAALKACITHAGLTEEEKYLLVSEGLAKRVNGKLSYNQEKMYGLCYDAYQYVIAIKKYANRYSALKKEWDGLQKIKKALFMDYDKFPPGAQELFFRFTAELFIERASLYKLSQSQGANILEQIIGDGR